MNVAAYHACFDHTWLDDAPLEQVRFVVLDSETTGLDPRRDRLITIGAVAVIAGEILLEDSIEVMCKLDYNRASVTVHGITRDETRDAMEESEALSLFLDYVKDGVIVGHHIGHDIQALNVAYQRHAGFELRNRSLDTMDLALHLNGDGAFKNMAQGFSLDGLCEMFGIPAHDRHTAGGDAFITAQVFLRLLRAARRTGRRTLAALTEPFRTAA
jgi:DNA polymerase III subunit epsilon